MCEIAAGSPLESVTRMTGVSKTKRRRVWPTEEALGSCFFEAGPLLEVAAPVWAAV